MQAFWMQLKDCLNENGIEINFTFKTTTFGILELYANENRLNNCMILQPKYFIFINKCKKSLPSWQAFKSYMKNRINSEKEIAPMKNKLREFQTNWEPLLNLFQ